ncbi:hypothetical protein BDD43_2810 [Mucilaginibacter gracilis]|uniref:Uncharacterized protein n=1 Tax=Mucilaginibacter gracilis TaxID=423350 RepID=A0A495J0W9_9SPHI|nr:hypothetical protein [Mucilaginibacter gracilis]RKR82625.1 hypothetical protein BDD43_2810 [Mucilaginibacter gracilis]
MQNFSVKCKSVQISGKELYMVNTGETLSIGGPYVGDAHLDNILIVKNCVADNFVYRDDLNFLFYVQYHKVNHHDFFTINFRNLINSSNFQFNREFKMVHIKGFISMNELEIFLAFHDELPNRKQIFNIDDEDFYAIDSAQDLEMQ